MEDPGGNSSSLSLSQFCSLLITLTPAWWWWCWWTIPLHGLSCFSSLSLSLKFIYIYIWWWGWFIYVFCMTKREDHGKTNGAHSAWRKKIEKVVRQRLIDGNVRYWVAEAPTLTGSTVPGQIQFMGDKIRSVISKKIFSINNNIMPDFRKEQTHFTSFFKNIKSIHLWKLKTLMRWHYNSDFLIHVSRFFLIRCFEELSWS